ncbi:hypothetical protein AAFF_G00056270 [Aldrovandia affinis]|uniref:Uncharacterized protein n=1 Tax=Aldrovandia affinis TaxID=143900 RepID=A0AAD7WEI9_9TELE|nr:hypothetical protein AAFF_G00056270 [Aldrovandia affinis]
MAAWLKEPGCRGRWRAAGSELWDGWVIKGPAPRVVWRTGADSVSSEPHREGCGEAGRASLVLYERPVRSPLLLRTHDDTPRTQHHHHHLLPHGLHSGARPRQYCPQYDHTPDPRAPGPERPAQPPPSRHACYTAVTAHATFSLLFPLVHK